MWYYAESSIKPSSCELIDNLYRVRRNIKQVEKEMEDGTKYSMYEWEESRMTENEYSQYKDIVKNAGNVDYLSMMTGIELPDEEGE